MKIGSLKFIGLLVAAVLLVASSAYADESAVAGMQNEIKALNKRLAALEGQLVSVESRVSKPAIAHPGHAAPEGTGAWLRDTEVGGYVEVQYNNNLTGSRSAPAGGNTARTFDNDTDSFTVNAVELNFTKEADPDGGAGFRFDLAFGEDTGVVIADGLAGDSVDLQQAYVEYVQPLSFWADSDVLPDTVKLTAGRFVTLAGAEVIEGPDNWNISRSLAFGLAIPFVHTGVRANFGLFNDYFDVYLGWNNGWDVPVDSNTYKTLEAAVGWSPMENVSLFHALYYGPETAATNGHKRTVVSNVLTWDVNDKLSFMADIDFGYERRFIGSVGADAENASWQAYAGYTRYQFTDKFAVAARAETFRNGGERNRTAGFPEPTDALWEATLTAEYRLTDNMLARLEYRRDKSESDDTFNGDSHQSIIGGQVIYVI
ncbi:MAG: porin [Candidatus Omnitrophota bacterium]|nr:porin [Candidatus Omnitrophota bacterium]